MTPLVTAGVIVASAAVASGALVLMRSAVARRRALPFLGSLAILGVIVGVASRAPSEYITPLMSGLGAAVIVHFVIVGMRVRRTAKGHPTP